MVRQELERCGGRQGGGGVVVMVVMVGIAEASTNRELLPHNIYLIFNPL